MIQADGEFDDPLAPAVASALCTMFSSTFTSVSLPEEINDEALEDSIVSPLFVIFRLAFNVHCTACAV